MNNKKDPGRRGDRSRPGEIHEQNPAAVRAEVPKVSDVTEGDTLN